MPVVTGSAPLRRLLADGAAIGAAFSAVVLSTLWLDRRLWLADYPPDIRAAVGPGVAAPFALQVAAGAAVMAVIVGGTALSNRRAWKAAPAAHGALAAFAHTVGLFVIVSLVVLLVSDWFALVTLRPDFAVFPGTGDLAGYRDYGYHVRAGFLTWRPWAGGLALSAIMAAVAWSWGRGDARG
ncbi:MAG: hypothetical protein AB7V01_13905 [Vicinamibacterales bacterium]